MMESYISQSLKTEQFQIKHHQVQFLNEVEDVKKMGQ